MTIINDFNKMKKIAKILRKVLQVLFWAFVVIGGLLIIGGAIISFIPGEHFELKDFYEGELTFSIDGLFTYEFTNEMGGSIMLKPLILLLVPTLLLNVVFYLINFRQVQSILKTVIDDQPFHENNSKSLSIMSVAFLVASIVFPLSGDIFFSKVFASIGLVGDPSMLSPNFTMMFTGILLGILSGVFKYGNYLQEEYNETV